MRTGIVLVIGLGLLPLAWGQERAVQDCRDDVADALSVPAGSVTASLGRIGANGNAIVNWTANLSGRRIRGFCETNRNGRVASVQLGGFRGGSIIDPGGSLSPVDVDTAGNGTFYGTGQTVRITRGWVDTRGEPSVALSGSNNFKITFWGTLMGSVRDREFRIRITRSDRGNASGTATVRLNSSLDEVEFISIDGRMGRNDIRGTFNRN